MFDTFRDENSIKAIATSLPEKLLNKFGKKEFYSSKEVENIFLEVFSNNVNIQYAYAMFCSPTDYKNLAQTKVYSSSYSELRLKVASECFEGWPRFNFESLINLKQSQSTRSDLVNEITDIGLDLLGGS
ncbi:DUF6559 family protein [Thalassotalea fusca]